MRYSQQLPYLVVIFAKAPIPGQVKTRLAADSSPEFAAHLHQAFVADLVHRLRALDVEIEIHSDAAAWHELRVPNRLQVAGDLGARMSYVFRQALQSRKRVLILGADSPSVPLEFLRELLESSADLAFGPADDGGYYAVAAGRWNEAMFQGVNWSTSSALADSVAAARQCGLSFEIGKQWFDIDEYKDLARLLPDLALLPETSSVIRNSDPAKERIGKEQNGSQESSQEGT
jgi:uncharacterized protein